MHKIHLYVSLCCPGNTTVVT